MGKYPENFHSYVTVRKNLNYGIVGGDVHIAP